MLTVNLDPLIPKKLCQWNKKYFFASSVIHELHMMPDSEIHHRYMSKIHQSSSLFSFYPNDKLTKYNTNMKEFTPE